MPHDPYFARKKPRQARSRALFDAVIAAASRILPERDPHEVTTHDIAERAGVSIGSLYQYFPGKEAIFGVLIDRRLDEDVEVTKRWLDEHEGSIAELLRDMTARLVELHRKDRTLYRAIFPIVSQMRRHRRVRRALADVRAAVRTRMEQQKDELRKRDLDVATFITGCALEGVMHAVVDERPELLDDPRFTEELVDLMVRYFVKD